MEGQQLEFDFIKDTEKPRQLTLVVNVLDNKKAKWLWDNHLNGDDSSGIRITSIANGDLNEKNMILEDAISDIQENAVIDNNALQRLSETMEKYDEL